MRKRRAAALPGAIAICTLLLIISLTVTTVIFSIVATNKIKAVNIDNNLYYLTYHNEFIDNNGDKSSFPTDKVNWETYNDGDIKVLVAKSKITNSLLFYSVYDFDQNKVLAYQTRDFYCPIIDGHYYYAGIVEGELA